MSQSLSGALRAQSKLLPVVVACQVTNPPGGTTVADERKTHAEFVAERRRQERAVRDQEVVRAVRQSGLSAGLPQQGISTNEPPTGDIIPTPAAMENMKRGIEQRERSSEKTVADPAPETTSPMHARDRRFYVILAWSAIPAALIVGCFIAWGGGQLPWYWAVSGIVMGLLGMCAATLYALEKKAPSPRYPGPIIIGIAVMTWVLIGWQTWLAFHSPVQSYTQAQLDSSVEAAKAKATAPIQAQLDTVTRQRDAALADVVALRHQLEAAQQPSAPTVTTITPAWNDEEIAIRSDLWRTIQKNVDGVVRAYNYSDTLLGKWEDQIPLNKKDYLRELSDLRGLIVATSDKIQEIRRDYPNYQDISAILDQPYVGPLLNSIDNFSVAIASIPDELPPNYQITIRPKAGVVLREMKAMLAWITNVRTTAGIKQKELSEMGQKQ